MHLRSIWGKWPGHVNPKCPRVMSTGRDLILHLKTILVRLLSHKMVESVKLWRVTFSHLVTYHFYP
jgi:hypothetical protein